MRWNIGDNLESTQHDTNQHKPAQNSTNQQGETAKMWFKYPATILEIIFKKSIDTHTHTGSAGFTRSDQTSAV